MPRLPKLRAELVGCSSPCSKLSDPSSGLSIMASHLCNLGLLLLLVISWSGTPQGEAASIDTMTKVELSGDVLCLDSKPAGFFMEQKEAVKKWVIFLQGGGGCDSREDCEDRSKKTLGTFVGRNDRRNKAPLIDDERSPLAAWSYAYIPYCSGDAWRGTSRENEWDLPMMGHGIVKGVVEALVDSYNMSTATHVVLAGSSAGGIGTLNNADWVKERLSPLGIDVRTVSDSGWFPSWANEVVSAEYDLMMDTRLTGYLLQQAYVDYIKAVKPYVHPLCWERLMPGEQLPDWQARNFSEAAIRAARHCGTGDNILPASNTSFFIRNNVWDSHTSAAGLIADNSSALELWRGRFAADMGHGIRVHGASFGFFAPSCFSHGAGYAHFIGQTHSLSAVALWHAANASSGDDASAYQLMDGYGRSPGQECNPSCGGECRCKGLMQACHACGAPEDGVILGFDATTGDVDHSRDIAETNGITPASSAACQDDGGGGLGNSSGEGCDPEEVMGFVSACRGSFVATVRSGKANVAQVCSDAGSVGDGSCLQWWWSEATLISEGECSAEMIAPDEGSATITRLAGYISALRVCNEPDDASPGPAPSSPPSPQPLASFSPTPPPSLPDTPSPALPSPTRTEPPVSPSPITPTATPEGPSTESSKCAPPVPFAPMLVATAVIAVFLL